jgi:hypothetical protein
MIYSGNGIRYCHYWITTTILHTFRNFTEMYNIGSRRILTMNDSPANELAVIAAEVLLREHMSPQQDTSSSER